MRDYLLEAIRANNLLSCRWLKKAITETNQAEEIASSAEPKGERKNQRQSKIIQQQRKQTRQSNLNRFQMPLRCPLKGKILDVKRSENSFMIGISVLLQAGITPYDLMVQTDTEALQIDACILKAEFNRGGKLNGVLLGYIYALICQISQSAVCHQFHTVGQRLARWLLRETEFRRPVRRAELLY